MISQVEKHDQFTERSYFEQLSEVAAQDHLTVFLFSPVWINWDERNTYGFFFNSKEKEWNSGTFPIPSFIYDRCFYTNRNHYNKYHTYVDRIRKDKSIMFLNTPLSGKWQMHQLLSKHKEIESYLPRTELYSDFNQIIDWFYDCDTLFLKPTNGTHGLGIFRIRKKQEEAYIIQGRTSPKRPPIHKTLNKNSLHLYINSLLQNKRYILQQALDLTTHEGDVFDIRVLVQKERSEDWKTTGSAVRLGLNGSITSNLHSGGKAMNLIPFLQKEYPTDTAQSIQSQIEYIVNRLPHFIEAYHGRLCEIGLDLGVDRSGKVWLLEANSKPGRRVFDLTNSTKSKLKSISRPIVYAQYLMQRKIGG